MRTAIENILRVYNHVGYRDCRDKAAMWYRRAHSSILEWNYDMGEQNAAIVAALSPGLRWEANLPAAKALIDGKPLDGFGVRWYANVRKAEAILKGGNPEKILRGNKVKAFWRCLADPFNRLHVVIDGHAYAIARGRRIPLNETPPLTDRLYRSLSSAYTEAANRVNILPLEMQAITWCIWRRLHGIDKAL